MWAFVLIGWELNADWLVQGVFWEAMQQCTKSLLKNISIRFYTGDEISVLVVKEVFGVLHLKGFIVDDSVIYSGASLSF